MKTPLKNPTNRVVSSFDNLEEAETAIEAMSRVGISKNQVRIFDGARDARSVDTSAKWFADTDVDIDRFQRALEDEKVVISVPIDDGVEPEAVTALCQRHHADLVTHFGTWVTEVTS